VGRFGNTITLGNPGGNVLESGGLDGITTRSRFAAAPVALVGLACALTACSDAGSDSGASASEALAACVVDGDAIPVVSDQDGVAPLGRLVTEIGLGDDGFGRIADVALDGSGSVVVADGQTQAATVFSLDGELLGSFSRRGSGPGEFEYLSRIVTGPDGAVYLAQRGRSAEFSGRPVPQHVETSALGTVTTADGVDYRVPELVAVLRGGSKVLLASRRVGESTPPPALGTTEVRSAPSQPSLLISTETGWRELSGLPEDRYFVGQDDEGLLIDGEVPFGAGPLFSATDSSVLLSPGSDYTIREVDAAGATLRSWTICGLTPREVTDAEIARFIDGRLENITDDALATAARSIFEAIEYPDAHPAVGGLIFDRSRHLWVRLESLGQGDAEIWAAFTTDGDWVGTFQAPSGVEVQDVRQGTAVGVRTDDLGVQTAVVLQLEL